MIIPAVLTTIEMRRWFKAIGVESHLPRTGRVLYIETPKPFQTSWKVEKQSKNVYLVSPEMLTAIEEVKK